MFYRLLFGGLLFFPSLSCLQDPSDSPNSDDTAGDSGQTVDTSPPEPMVTGNIDTRDGTYTGAVSIVRAFSFYDQGNTIIYGASNPDATCESVARGLGAEGDYDPNELFLSEHCNLVFQISQTSPVDTFDIQVDTGAYVRANCAYEAGDWSWTDGFVGEGWYYSGQYYSPLAWKGTFAVEVSDTSARSLSVPLDLREWEGQYPHDADDTDEHKASGRIEGTFITTDCEDLEDTPWF